MTKILFFADNDVTGDAEEVNAAMLKETNVDAYCFVGDGPYSESGTEWVDMMKQSFDDKKDKLMLSRGNHDEDESESKQTQKDIEAWFPQAKGVGISDCWLSSKQVGNVYIIDMDSQDLDVEFKRDQFNWVTAELQKAKQLRTEGKIDWIVALFHKPAFTLKSSHSPYTAVRFLYKDIFADAQLDFWIHGHNHNTQFWKPMVPNASQANGEGEQKFSLASDGKTYDFNKDHGWVGVVTGHAGHEWNAINDSGAGVSNVLYFRDSGKFGYTVLETNGKNAKLLAKDTDNATLFEYPPITREGGTTPPPPEECPEGQHKDPTTGQCVPDTVEPPSCPTGQHWDSQLGKCVDDVVIPPPPPPPTGTIICPRDYHFDESLQRCIPDLEPKINPVCPNGYKWDKTKGQCISDGTTPPPPPPQGEIVAKAQPTINSKPTQTVILDGSQSTGAITRHEWLREDNSGIPIILEPATPNFSNKFVATDAMVGKEIKYKLRVFNAAGTFDDANNSTTVVVTKDDIPPPPPPPPTEGQFDEHGTKMLHNVPDLTKKVPMEVGSDHRNGQRYNNNHSFKNYMMIGYFKTGKGQEKLEMKTDGPNHGGCTKLPECMWYEPSIVVDSGKIEFGGEWPHPTNKSGLRMDFHEDIAGGIKEQWLGYSVIAYTNTQGQRVIEQWCAKDPFDASGKPTNNWKMNLQSTETGDGKMFPSEYVPRDLDKVIAHEAGFESEIRMHQGTNHDCEMKWCYVYEIDPLSSTPNPNPVPPTPVPPTPIPPTPQPPTPTPPPTNGDLLWDSNIHGKWNDGNKRTAKKEGDQGANGKGWYTSASGSPRLIIDGDGVAHLQADPGHGRVYILATNYSSKLSGEINIESDAIDSCTLRLRSRHQEGGDGPNRFGGYGCSVFQRAGTVEFQTESFHNEHENTIEKQAPKQLEIGKWYKFEYSCCDSADHKSANFLLKIDYNDGSGLIEVLTGSHTSPQPYFQDEATIMKSSYIWLRINNASETGSVAFKNVKLEKI